MPKYFIDPYQKYYEKLSSSLSIVENATSLKSSAENVAALCEKLSSQVEDASWSELGHTALSSEVLPLLSEYTEILNENIDSGLVILCYKCINELFPLLSSLKEKDELLEEKQQELTNKKNENVQATISDGLGGTKTNPDYDSWKREISALETEINTLDNELQTLKQDIDGVIDDIKSLDIDSAYFDLLATDSEYYLGEKEYHLDPSMLQGKEGRMLNYGEYNVVDTAMSVVDFVARIQEEGLYQTSLASKETKLGKAWLNKCNTVSYIYAYDLMKNPKELLEWGNPVEGKLISYEGYFKNPGTEVKNSNDAKHYYSTQEEALEEMYRYLKSGIPVALNVNQQERGRRHWVTVVGMKSSVTSAEDLKATDLLIIDTYDGQLERMDCSDSRKFLTGYETGQKYDYRFDPPKKEAREKTFGIELLSEEQIISG